MCYTIAVSGPWILCCFWIVLHWVDCLDLFGLYCTLLYYSATYYTLNDCNEIYCTVRYCSLMYCTLPYCSAMCGTVLYFSASKYGPPFLKLLDQQLWEIPQYYVDYTLAKALHSLLCYTITYYTSKSWLCTRSAQYIVHHNCTL